MPDIDNGGPFGRLKTDLKPEAWRVIPAGGKTIKQTKTMKKNDYSIKVTKRILLWEQNNDMCHNYYYLVYVRIYNADGTRYRKARFVVWFDAVDVCDFVEADTYTAIDVANMLDEQIYIMCDMINGYDDTKSFYEMCGQTIRNYNKIAA